MKSFNLVDGQPVRTVALDNRGLSYGDGLFETVLICGGKPLWLDEHLQRLVEGAHRLAIPCNLALVTRDCSRLLADLGAADAILKITLTRGTVTRGYSPLPSASHRIISVSPVLPNPKARWQQGVAIGLCQTKLARQPLLAGLKHLNRLEQVLAAGEMQRRGFAEGLVQDEAGKIIEATRSNVFIVTAGKVVTPSLNECGVDGIMRQQIILAAERLGLEIKVAVVEMSALRSADEVFICNSVFGIWPVTKIECLHKTIGPVCRKLQWEFESHFYA
jgi:4-amino-4-deoxychorismate lyase